MISPPNYDTTKIGQALNAIFSKEEKFTNQVKTYFKTTY